MQDLFGKAMMDFYTQEADWPLILHTGYGPPEQIPLDRFFMEESEFSDLDYFALEQARGHVLDIGAGSGRHALALQNRGLDVMAMDISPACCSIMKMSGLRNIILSNIFGYTGKKFDTLLMLMNGIGIAGNVDGIHRLFNHLKTLIKPGGQVLLDSTDIGYLYQTLERPGDHYYGELTFRYEYNKKMGDPFQWVYIDQEFLSEIAEQHGWNCQIVFEDETEAYLARLQLK